MTAENTFDIGGSLQEGGVRFTVRRLKPKASLAGLRLVGKVLLPALAEAHAAPEGQFGGAVQRVVEGLDCLPELLDLFSAVSKYQSVARPNPTELGPLVDDVFLGHPEWIVEYLVQCVQHEYGGFLAAKGLLGGILAKAAAASSASPKASAMTG